MVYNLIISVKSDQIDSFILTVAYIALAMAAVSIGINILFLIDYFKRHGWIYKHKPKKKVERSSNSIDPGFEHKNKS